MEEPAEATTKRDSSRDDTRAAASGAAALLFQSNPDRWDLRKFLEPGTDESWRATRYHDEVRPGRLVLLWQAKGSRDENVRGLYGWGVTVGELFRSPGEKFKRIRLRYVERWVSAANATTDPTEQAAAIAADEVLGLESWRENSPFEPVAAATNFLIGLDQLRELLRVLVLPKFPDTLLKRAVAMAAIGQPLAVDAFSPATLTEAPPPAESHSTVSLRILSDSPIRTLTADRLGFTNYADAIAGLINEKKTSTPLTLAINARWGVGKSSLGHLVEDALKSRSRLGGPRHITCWFDAWMHDDAEDLTPSLLAHVARTANAERPFWRRLCQPIPVVLLPSDERWEARMRRLAVFLAAGVLITAAALWRSGLSPPEFWKLGQELIEIVVPEIASERQGTTDTTKTIFGGAWIAILALVFKGWSFFAGSAKAIASFVANPQDEAKSGSLPKVREQIGSLIRQATGDGKRRFVLFVDDLERCRPPLAVSLLETVNQLLNHPDMVTVVMADMPGVEAHVQIKYESLASRYQVAVRDIPEPLKDDVVLTRTYGRHYLSKIIQLQFDLPRAVKMDRLLEKPKPPAEKPASALFSESIEGLYAFADGRRLNPLTPLLENLRRWRDRGPLAGPLLVALWLPALPLLLAGAVTEIAFHVLPFTRTREPVVGSASDKSAAYLTLMGASILPAVLGWGALVDLDLLLTVLAIYAGVLVGVFLLIGLGREVDSWRQALLRKRFAESIDKLLDRRGGDLEATSSADAVVRELKDTALAEFAKQPAGKDLLREKHLHHLSEDSELLKAAWKPADTYLPRIPRHLKRFHNRLRLLLYVADRRKMFGAEPLKTAEQIGKWAVLQEVWPDLALKLADRPERMKALEEDVAAELEALLPRYAEDEELKIFLTEEPRLGQDLERLTRFRPAPVPA